VNKKRRDFILGSANVAGALIPGLAWAAEPCPPPRVSLSGGTSVATACEITTGRRYSTNFNLTENPISEGGVWFNTGQLWTKVRTANGLAFGTNGPRNTYDDSYAYLSGFAPNQQGEAVIYVSPNLVGDPHEVELLLRWADSAQIARGYECLFNHLGGVQIVRWNGPFGNYSVLSGRGRRSLGRELVSGDVVKGTVIGNTITAYINGVEIYEAVDSMWTSGQPGIGFFKRTAGLNTDLAITSYTATSL
jgi:hypothetical protein